MIAPAAPRKPPHVRAAQAVLLLLGALFLVFVVAPDDTRFPWTPLGLGLAYLGAAVAGGRHGGHWATACVLTGWGAAVVLAAEGRPGLDTSGLYLAGAGLGVSAGLLLARRGVAVDPLGMAATLTGAGVVLALTPQLGDLLADARTYAVVLALIAVANLALAARGARTEAVDDGR